MLISFFAAMPAAAQEFLEGDYLQDFEDASFNPSGGIWYPNWYGVTSWSRNTTQKYAGASSAAAVINTSGNYNRIIGFNADFTNYDTWLGNSIVDTISFWYKISSYHADSRVMRVIAGQPADFFGDCDEISNPPYTNNFQDADWIPLTNWRDIRNDTVWTQCVISSSDTDLSVFNDVSDIWIAIQLKRPSGTTNRTFYIDNFEIKLRPRPVIIPNPPTPLAPPDGHETRTSRPFFSWIHNDTDGAPQARYHLQIADSSSFINIIVNDSDANDRPETTIELSYSLPYPADSILYWRVRTSNFEDSYSAWSSGDSWFRARLIPPETPIIIGPPANHETTVRIVRFQWTHNDPDSSPQNYAIIQFCRAPDMLDTSWIFFIVDSSTYADTTFPAAEDTIYWRLRTADELDSSPWTESRVLYLVYADTPVFRSITVTNDTPARFVPPVLFDTGTNGDTVWFGPADQLCTAVVTVTSRRFDSVAVSAIFDSPARVMPAPSPVSILFQIASGHAHLGETLVTLVAWDRSGATETTRIRFRPDTVAPETVALIAPESGAYLGGIPTCTWTVALDTGGVGTSHYILQIAADSGFTAIIRQETTTATTRTLGSPLTDSIYFWRVQAVDRVGNATTATAVVRVFIIDSTSPTPASLIAPADAYETSRVPIRFEWTASTDSLSGIAWQRLEIARDSSFAAIDTSLLLGPLDTTVLAGDSLAGSDTFWWRVASRDSAGNETVSIRRSFILDTTPPNPAALSQPVDAHDTLVTTIRFTWSVATDSHTGVASYRIQVDTDPAFGAPLIDSNVALQTETDLVLPANDTYRWRILVTDRAGNIATGAARLLRIDTAPPSRPGLIAPIGGETRLAPVGFRWSAATDTMTGLASYRLQAASDSVFTILTLNQTLDSTVTSDTRWLDTGLWYWRVLAIDRVGNTETSFVDSVQVQAPPDTTPPAAFSLLAPPTNSETNAVAILFRWQDAADSSPPVRYTLTVLNAAGAHAFEAEIFETSILVTLPANDSYRWSVTATDSPGTPRLSTETFTFVIDTAPPSAASLLLPTAQDTNTTSFTFSWSASSDSLSGVQGYWLQIDTSGTFTTLVAETSGFFLSTSLTLAANDIYYWRVITTDSATNIIISDSRWLRIDTAPPSTPSLRSPGNAEDTISPVLFRWDASTDSLVGLDAYRLQISTTAAFETGLAADSTLATTETSVPLSPDTWYWRVTVSDRLGNTAISETRQLQVVIASESMPPIITAASATPNSVTNVGTETTRFTITAIDTSRIDTVVAHLSILGAHYAATMMDTTADSTQWRLDVRIDTRVLGDTYLIRVTVTDRYGNTSETRIRLVVRDVSPSYAAITNIILPRGETVLPVSGNALTLTIETGSIPGVTAVHFEYRPSGDSLWIRADSSPYASTPNPATGAPPWTFVWALPEISGRYDIRAVGITTGGESDPSPSFLSVVVSETHGLIREYWSAESQSITFLLLKETAQAFHLGRFLLMTTSVSTLTSSDSLRIHAVRYETAPDSAPAPNGRTDGSGLQPLRGVGYFQFEIMEAGRNLDQACTISLRLGGISGESRAALSWYRFDTALRRWIRQTSSIQTSASNDTVTLTVSTRSFSLWAPLLAMAEANLARVIVYPNPYIPNDNNARTGVPYVHGVDGTGVIFDRLTEAVTIEIYTISGVRVTTIRSQNSGGRIHWNAQNDNRRDLASGVYLCVIKSGTGERVVRKLMIIR